MRLRRFEVQGYKNLTSPVVLEELASINILHGDNNVGKSNLLEAMELFFLCAFRSARDPKVVKSIRVRDLTEGTGLDGSTIFNPLFPQPIRLEALLGVDPSDVGPSVAIRDPFSILVTVTLSRDPTEQHKVRIETRYSGDLPESLTYGGLEAMLAIDSNFNRRFQHVGVHREVWSGPYAEGSTPSVPAGRQFIPPALSLALYDLYNAEDPRQVARWEMLVEALRDFQDLFDGGTPVPVFRRAENRALITIQAPGGGRIAADLLGSGLQQVIGLLGRLAVGGASFLALEEPELNLRYDLQERLRGSLVRMANDPRVGMQMFLTSHSPAFEVGESFFAMRKGPRGPVVERRPVGEAAAFTGTSTLTTPLPHSWLSSDGVLRVPEDIRHCLGLVRGGPVAFVETDEPEVLLMSNAAFGRSLDR